MDVVAEVAELAPGDGVDEIAHLAGSLRGARRGGGGLVSGTGNEVGNVEARVRVSDGTEGRGYNTLEGEPVGTQVDASRDARCVS